MLLGFDQVRSTAYSLAYYTKMHSDSASPELRDSMVKSFLSGMLARQLAENLKLPGSEEAFICGLFQNLGENLVIYYFPEDYAEICQFVDPRQADKQTVSSRVLGVRYADIGSEVAKIWALPESIVAAIRGAEDGDKPAEADPDKLTRSAAIFANELCDHVILNDVEWQDHVYWSLMRRFGSAFSLTEETGVDLFADCLNKMLENASVLDLDPYKSPFILAARHWLERRQPEDEEEPAEASAASE